MSLFSQVSQFEPYFHSIRRFNDVFVIDIKLPKNWEYSKVAANYADHVGVKNNGEKGKYIFLSYMSTNDMDSVNKSVELIHETISYNKDKEYKEELMQKKMIELQRMFETADIETLNKLEFKVNKYEEESRTEVASEGDAEGRDGDSETQDESDTTDSKDP